MKLQLSKVLPKTSKEVTDAVAERGEKQLHRLATLIDVLYALIIFQIFLFLPRPDVDNFTANELINVLKSSGTTYLVMVVGMIMVIIYWGQSNLQFGNLKRTDGKHATLSIIQTFSLMLYFYFVRLDVELGGAIITLKMESIFLALAGFISIWCWYYSIKNELVSKRVDIKEENSVYLQLLPEPITSVLTFPFAYLGPDIWTLSWLLLIPVSMITKRIRKRMILKQVDKILK